MGIEGTNSNGHGGGKEEDINLVETLRKLQTDIQSYKDDIERLMKAKEHQKDFNMKMEILYRIENKLDKESGSSKSRSHKSPKGKGISRSGIRHHHHSQNNSHKRAHNISSPSPVMKYHRMSGVDELKGEMDKIKPLTFDGEHNKDEDAETWLLGMRKYFQLNNYSSHAEGRISIYHMKGKASMWWDHLVQF